VVATLDCEFDCWFVTDTVSVPLVLFAMVDVVRLHVYWSLLHAELHAANPVMGSRSNVATKAIKGRHFNFFIFLFLWVFWSADCYRM